MKYLIASAALFANLSVAAAAQTMMAPAPAAAAVAAFSIDSPIEQLVANPATKTVLEADFPGVTTPDRRGLAVSSSPVH